MFSPDVVNLREFYALPIGRRVSVLVSQAITALWPDAKGDAMLGIGYTVPYAEPYLVSAAPLIMCMPAGQGAVYWPPEAANRVFMGHESELPLQENSINRILLVHAIENSEQLSWLMQELWRVLTPGGRVLAVAPNRMGLWSHSSRSPFGYGRPFSMVQLRDLFSQNHFTVTRSGSALFVPPTRFAFMWRLAPKLEYIGKSLCPFFGGVLLIEAEKQLNAAIRQTAIAKRGYRMSAAATKPVMGLKHQQ